MKKTLLRLSRVANALNRSLVLPPLPCSKGKWKYCNVCSFDRVDCFKDIIPSFKNPVKESIFFMKEYSLTRPFHYTRFYQTPVGPITA